MLRSTLHFSVLIILVAALFGGGILRVSYAQEVSPQADEMPEIAVAFSEAWSSGNPEQLVDIYAEDALFEEVVLGGAATHSRDELRAYARSLYAAFPDFTATPVSGFISGNWAVVEWVLTGTYTGQFGSLPPGTGQPVGLRVATVLELDDDGLIRRDSEYWDSATVLTQLGAMPEAEAAATPAP